MASISKLIKNQDYRKDILKQVNTNANKKVTILKMLKQ